MRAFKLLAPVVVLAAAAALLLYADYQRFLQTPLAVDGDAERIATLTVDPGDGVAAVAAELDQRGALPARFGRYYARLYVRLHPDRATIRPGEYALDASLTFPALLDKLAAGDVIRYRITIPEGRTFRQMLAALYQHPQIDKTLADDADAVDAAALMAALGAAGEHPEGQFFPATYTFAAGTSDLELLRRAYEAMRRELAAAWALCTPEVPLESPYQALIMASIIERETGSAGERERISGVFARRLERGMRLQTDPTVIYGLGDAFDGNLRRRDLRADTPYNTYTRAGLPPTPIALPGRAALDAACRPDDDSALYFVAKGDGSHAFADTLREHNNNVRAYQLQR